MPRPYDVNDNSIDWLIDTELMKKVTGRNTGFISLKFEKQTKSQIITSQKLANEKHSKERK